MLPNLKKFLVDFDSLGLQKGDYLLTGSCTLAALGIRDCGDLDVLVIDPVGETLKERYPDRFHRGTWCDKLVFPDMEIMWNFKAEGRPYTSERQVDEAVEIGGRYFQPLEKVKFYKQQQGREKDLADLKLIEIYENENK